MTTRERKLKIARLRNLIKKNPNLTDWAVSKIHKLEESESEDKRIRDVLVDYFKRYKEQEECGIKTFYGIPTDNIITWLKKQQCE